MLKIAAYTRSSPSQNGSSSEHQSQSCDRMARYYLGSPVSHRFSDLEKHGTETERPGLMSLINAVRQDQIDAVIVHSFDRLCCNPEDLAMIGKILRAANTRLFSEQGEIHDVIMFTRVICAPFPSLHILDGSRR
ncbi:MAG: recombinase family protein [Sphingomonadaceae bacterium]|nr:recombinase family protein [Sphingomonadaceae bacterium]